LVYILAELATDGSDGVLNLLNLRRHLLLDKIARSDCANTGVAIGRGRLNSRNCSAVLLLRQLLLHSTELLGCELLLRRETLGCSLLLGCELLLSSRRIRKSLRYSDMGRRWSDGLL
jgi:hypothetical protein